MSKETTTTTRNSEYTSSADELQEQFDAPSYTGVRPNGEQVADSPTDWLELHSYIDGKYRFVTEDLIDSRLVVDPYASLVTDSPKSESAVNTTQANIASNPEAQDKNAVPTSEVLLDQPDSDEKESLLNRLRGKLGSVAERLVSKVKNERVKRKLGLAADRLMGTAKYEAWRAQSLPSDLSEKSNKARQLEEYQVQEGDNRRTRVKKWLGRNAVTLSVGSSVVGGLIMAGVARQYLAYESSGHRSVSLGVNEAANSIDIGPVEHEFTSTMIVAGGFGQGPAELAPIGELRDKGFENGVNVEGVGVNYPGQMGLGAGEMSMDESAIIGEADMYAKYERSKSTGELVHLAGYSEGSLVATRTANRIAAENGGVLPDNVRVTLIGSPYQQYGIGNNVFGQALNPILDHMGIPLHERPPAGTEVVYMDTDPYANAANMNPTTLLKNLLTLPMGTHAIPDQVNMQSYTFTDNEGIIHTVYSGNEMLFQALELQGLHIADTASANAAINAFFPIGKNGEPLPADVRAGLAYSATAMDNQIAEAMGLAPGSVRVVQDIVANMPPEFKDLGQAGFDAVNNITTLGAEIAAGKIDPLTGFTKIMGEFQNFTTKLGVAIPNPEQGHTPVNDWGFNSARDITNNATGQNFSAEFNAAREESAEHLKKLAEEWRVKAEEWRAEQAAAAEAKAAAAESAASNANQAPAWTPSAPAATPTAPRQETWTPPAAPAAPAPQSAPAAPEAPAPAAPAAAPVAEASPVVAPAPEAAPAAPAQKPGGNFGNFLSGLFGGGRGNANVHTQTGVPLADIPVPAEAPRGAADIADNVGVPTSPIGAPAVDPDLQLNDLTGANK